ncbi:HNH endonuclease [Mesorhizobium sp. CAU 1732]|uniref:HNH endonuclease n=1 Tax=Mesorhizobium sp. CAU 1732 TaxID=3140358 RepID=UPI0032617CD0
MLLFREPMTLSFSYRESLWDNAATIEHLHRKVDGGGNDRGNTVLSCRRCNQRRDERPWPEYRHLRLDGRMV